MLQTREYAIALIAEQMLKIALLTELPQLTIRVVLYRSDWAVLGRSGQVAKYQGKLTRLSDVALSRGESREVLVAMASEFDRPEDSPDAPDHLAEEQFQLTI